jgi:beta-glucosidase
MATTGGWSLPPEFRWGVATAAYQIEGATAEDGRTPSIWDTFVRQPGAVFHGEDATIAADHYHRWREDLALLRELGATDYRWSVSWSRVMPEPGKINQAGLDFYRRIAEALAEAGISSMTTLYHWDLPQWAQDAGGWPNRATVGLFRDYVEAVATAFGDLVPRWITVNEPYCASFLGHAAGVHAPGWRDEVAALSAAHHLLLAHGHAVQILKALCPHAEASLALNLTDVLPSTPSEENVRAARLVDLVENRLFLEPVLAGRLPDDAVDYYRDVTDFGFILDGDLATVSTPMDFLGFNYYRQHHVVAVPGPDDSAHDFVRGVGRRPPQPPVSGHGTPIRPDGLYNILTRVTRDYGAPPIWITENGVALHDYPTADGRVHDPERIDYLDAHLRQVANACAAGVPVHGYLVWSFLDTFEWDNGYRVRYGLVYVDLASQRRIAKDSFAWLRRAVADAKTAQLTPSAGANPSF